MDFLLWLQELRFPLMDSVMKGITLLGTETAFLVFAFLFMWCVDKRRGYYIATVGFFGSITNQLMKLYFRIPRPWVADPRIVPVEGTVEGAGGYSFPSGHSQTGVGLLGGVAITEKRRWLRIVLIVFMVLVPFSRLYLGVHTPADVLVGSLQSIILLAVLYPVFFCKDGKYIPVALVVQLALAIVYLVYVHSLDAAALDAHNFESGMENAYTFLGCTTGMLLVYLADCKWPYDTKAVWWAQLIKVGVGFILVLAVKELLRAPLNTLFNSELTGRAVRYFLLTVVGGVLWPRAFRFFPKK